MFKTELSDVMFVICDITDAPVCVQCAQVESTLLAVTMVNVMMVTLATAPAPVTWALGAWPASAAALASTGRPVKVSGAASCVSCDLEAGLTVTSCFSLSVLSSRVM